MSKSEHTGRSRELKQTVSCVGSKRGKCTFFEDAACTKTVILGEEPINGAGAGLQCGRDLVNAYNDDDASPCKFGLPDSARQAPD